MIWPCSFSDQEIRAIASNCLCPQNYAVALTLDYTEMYEKATFEPVFFGYCPPF